MNLETPAAPGAWELGGKKTYASNFDAKKEVIIDDDEADGMLNRPARAGYEVR